LNSAYYDAVLVLGGGVREGGELPSWSRRRFDVALSLPSEAPIVALSAGTTHRPVPVGDDGLPIFEAVAGANYLLRRGVPGTRIFLEFCSWDTIGNAFFSRVVHAEPAQWRRLMIVTSDWHMPRTKLIFDWVYGLSPRPFDYDLEYVEASDPEMDGEVYRERVRKEERSAASVREVIASIRTLQGLHRWLFTNHEAYRAGGNAFSSSAVNELTRGSY
jgi:hypothetical protein